MGKQIFEGIKILDFTWVGVGPITIRNFADHGAFVIHIESHTRPEALRVAPPFKDGTPDPNKAAFMANFNTSKYGIALDLNTEKGKEIVKRFLVEWKPDIMAESYSPKAMENWGLDWENVKKLRPDIIYYSASQQGRFGPHRMFAGFGMMASALGGYAHITGWPDRLPAIPYGAYTDFISPFYGACALVAALDWRRKTGEGQYIDLSQYECGQQFLSPALMDYILTGKEICRNGNRHDAAVPHGVFPCKEKETWVSIAVFDDDEWQAFCEVLGGPDWTKDERFKTFLGRRRHEDELEQHIAAWTKEHTPAEVMTCMQDAGVPAGIVHPPSGLYEDPQLKHWDFFVELNHTGIGPHKYDGLTTKLSKTPGKLCMPSPILGEHNEKIFKECLGMSDEEIGDLIAEQVITNEGQYPWLKKE